jgi:hypothetical protein
MFELCPTTVAVGSNGLPTVPSHGDLFLNDQFCEGRSIPIAFDQTSKWPGHLEQEHARSSDMVKIKVRIHGLYPLGEIFSSDGLVPFSELLDLTDLDRVETATIRAESGATMELVVTKEVL